MASDIKVIINTQKVVGKIGFGIPLILSGKETTATAYTECKSLDEVKKVFAETTNVYKAAKLLFMQDNAPAKIAVCGLTDKVTTGISSILNNDWRQLIVTSTGTEGEDTIKDIADYIETTGDKMYFASVSDLTDITGITGNDRTVLFYYDIENVVEPVAALVGATAGLKVGSFTYKNIILKGLEPLELSDTQINNIHSKGAITFVTKAGDNVTTEGKVVSGEYIDIIDSKDYIIKNLEYQTQKTLNNSLKVPYTNQGIAMLESVAINVLQDAFNNGIIATDEDGNPDYSVNYAMREETEDSDRAARKYLGGQFSFSLSGAVHEAEIVGEILV